MEPRKEVKQKVEGGSSSSIDISRPERKQNVNRIEANFLLSLNQDEGVVGWNTEKSIYYFKTTS